MYSSPPSFRERRIAEGIRAPIAVLVGDDQVQVLTVTQRPVALEAVDRRQVVRFHPEPIVIELFDGYVFYSGWIEALE
jgi:glutamine amidotransferase PdxT